MKSLRKWARNTICRSHKNSITWLCSVWLIEVLLTLQYEIHTQMYCKLGWSYYCGLNMKFDKSNELYEWNWLVFRFQFNQIFINKIVDNFFVFHFCFLVLLNVKSQWGWSGMRSVRDNGTVCLSFNFQKCVDNFF